MKREQAPDRVSAWVELSEAVRSSRLPVRKWLETQLPNKRDIFAQFRTSVGQIRVTPSSPSIAGTGTIGWAYEHLVRFILEPAAAADSALAAIRCLRNIDGPTRAQLTGMIDYLRVTASTDLATAQTQTIRRLARGCWLLAYATEVSNHVGQRSLNGVHRREQSTRILDELVPDAVEAELMALHAQALEVLLPFVEGRLPIRFRPSFASALPATGDILAGTTLIEVKTLLSRRDRFGNPRYGLDSRMLFQVVAYGLLGHDDFGIDRVAIFNARYGHIYSWRLHDLLSEMAGADVDTKTIAAEFKSFLNRNTPIIDFRSNQSESASRSGFPRHICSHLALGQV
jgi:hypothetical protein